MKLTVIVAGPGAGKTHNMVNEIATRIPTLSRNRFLVAITYTNAAADMIRTRLHRRVRPARNVYIGTIHSFLNRFILSPFAVVLEQLPEDHIFISADVNVPKNTKSGGRLTPQQVSIAKAAKLSALLKRGIVSYEKMGSVAATLVERKEIRRLVGHGLQFLFVDEFQDVDTTQHRVFESLRKEKKTSIYVVGDPEQYISSFTYRVRGIKAPEYGKIPFFRFASQSDCQNLEVNRRSCDEVVDFTNQFHGQLKQKGQQGTRGVQRVVFVKEHEVAPIIERFRSLTDEWHSGNTPVFRTAHEAWRGGPGVGGWQSHQVHESAKPSPGEYCRGGCGCRCGVRLRCHWQWDRVLLCQGRDAVRDATRLRPLVCTPRRRFSRGGERLRGPGGVENCQPRTPRGTTPQ